jgi:hypothetical protein
LDREGIVAESTIRFAAGASIIAASLKVAGPNPAQAVADKHNSPSYTKDNDRSSSTTNRSSIGGGSGGNWMNGVLGGTDNDQPPLLANGGGDVAAVQSIDSDGPVALRSAAVTDQPTGVNAAGAVAPPLRARSDYSSAPAGALRSPRVVIGNGRSPGDPVPGTWSAPQILQDSSLEAPVDESVPAVPDAVVDLPPLPPPLPPTEHILPAVVVGELGIGTIDTTTDPLAGVAGLTLIPAVGAVLGYRQARAARSVRESART